MRLLRNLVTPLFVCALVGTSPAWSQAAETTTKPVETKPGETKKAPSKTDRLDINSASVDELKGIRGINEAQAKKIVEGRPYKRRNELVSKKVLPQETYDKIKDRISTRQPSKS